MMGAPSLLPCPAFTRKRTVSPHIGVLPVVWGTVRCRSAHLGEITITNSRSLFFLLRRVHENERQLSTVGLWESCCFRVFSSFFLFASMQRSAGPWETGAVGCSFKTVIWRGLMLLLIVGSLTGWTDQFRVAVNRSNDWKSPYCGMDDTELTYKFWRIRKTVMQVRLIENILKKVSP